MGKSVYPACIAYCTEVAIEGLLGFEANGTKTYVKKLSYCKVTSYDSFRVIGVVCGEGAESYAKALASDILR